MDFGARFRDRWLESAAIGLPLDHEVVGVAGEAVNGALGADRIGEGGEPLVGTTIGGNDD